MPLIGSIVLDDINDPCDLATALRLLLVDHLDRDEYGIENPDSPYTQDGKLNYRFCGDETSFVLGFETGRGALRVDVRQVDYDEPDSVDGGVDADPDQAARVYLESLIDRLGLPKVIAAVGNRHAADLDGKPGITAEQWDLLDNCVNTLGYDEALGRLCLSGQTGDESRLVAAYQALKIPLGVALRRLEDESDEEPAEPPAKVTDRCCEGGCRFSLKRLLGMSRPSPSPSPTTKTPGRIELDPSEGGKETDRPASDIAGQTVTTITASDFNAMVGDTIAPAIAEFIAATEAEGSTHDTHAAVEKRLEHADAALVKLVQRLQAPFDEDIALAFEGKLLTIDQDDDGKPHCRISRLISVG
jgi:hypothetical protein